MELDKDFKEFIELLNEHKVNYLVIGGYAVNYHGYPRYTKDIDFWIWQTQNNFKKLRIKAHSKKNRKQSNTLPKRRNDSTSACHAPGQFTLFFCLL